VIAAWPVPAELGVDRSYDERGIARDPRTRDPRGGLAGGALLAIVASDLSGLSKGEVERIWLPFAVWLPALGQRRAHRGWLTVQIALGLLLQLTLVTDW
jgi:hypothetical protein